MNLGKLLLKREKKAVYHDGKKVYKVFEKGYPKSSVLNEALNQSRIEETGLDIPKIIEVTVIDDCWAIVMDYIKGETLASLMKANPKKLKFYLELFVDLQLLVHSKRSSRLNPLQDKMNRKIDLTRDELDATIRYDLHTRIEGMPKHIKVCHCDFNPGNIIVSTDGKPYILDWSHASQGNGAADAAITYLLFCLDGSNKTAEKYLDLYCKKSETAKQYVNKWFSIAAASRLCESPQKEKSLLMRFIDIVDY
ncbi:MAG: aminoglycoside phosphotransferase family protein [Elusimicrobiota bacterium]|jgi:aminoglycoside phosphotransferase (APT) family kinase protein|nr:aminoglycoside phosphotransferase family protein [Elusimicrobiota bacterium]